VSNTREQSNDQVAPSSTVTLTVAAIVVALASIVGAIYQLLTSGPPGASYETVDDYVRELAFLTYLVGTIVAIRAARTVGIITRNPSWLIVIGYGLITVGVTIGLALRDDPDWFFLLGGPGNLLAAIGFVAWGVIAGRTKVFSWWLAGLCIVGSIIAVLFAEFGTGLVIAAFWIVIAVRTRAIGSSSAIQPPLEGAR
jgi:hypothetical protein